jgi:hypothetical protein
MTPGQQETLAHIRDVRTRLDGVAAELARRGEAHDASKLVPPERDLFDAVAGTLRGLTYGSPEYRAALAGALKPALDHHYKNNSHHPEHYPAGVRGMCLIDVVEMFADWHAACRRHANGDIRESIRINQTRFGYSDELRDIFLNTVPLLDALAPPAAPATPRVFD